MIGCGAYRPEPRVPQSTLLGSRPQAFLQRGDREKLPQEFAEAVETRQAIADTAGIPREKQKPQCPKNSTTPHQLGASADLTVERRIGNWNRGLG
jgi:hypothetical protein